MNDYRFLNFKLTKEATNKKLSDCGFNYNNRKVVNVYKNLIQLKMYVENDEDGKPCFYYDVYDVCNCCLYSPYYMGSNNTNLVLDEVNNNVKKELDKLLEAKILRISK